MKKDLQHTSSEPLPSGKKSSDIFRLDISIPTSWQQLTPKQARWLLRFLSMPQHSPSIDPRAIALMRFTGIRIIGAAGYAGEYLIEIPTGEKTRILKRKKKMLIFISPEEFAFMLRELDWLMRPLSAPWRPDSIAGRKPVTASLDSLPFGSFLALDNLFAGVLSLSRNDAAISFEKDKRCASLIDSMADLLLQPRPRYRLFRKRISPADRYALIIWFSAAKERIIRTYPDFYRPAADDSLTPEAQTQLSPARLRQVMNAQIRALTKGDITKEEQILSLPLERAMTELNALAKEYAELHAKSK